MIVLTNTDRGRFFLDATDPLRPPGLLGENDLNGKGLLLKKDSLEWISINNNEKPRFMVSATYTIFPDGLAEINYDKSDYGLYAYTERKNISDNFSNKDYAVQKILTSVPDATIIAHSLDNTDSLASPLQSHIKFRTHRFSNLIDNTIYIDPIINFTSKENPFALEARKMPVEFPFGFEETYYINIIPPEGFTAKELPKSVIIKLPDDAAVFSYMTGITNNMIQIKCKLAMNATYFGKESYEDMREFYSKILEKKNEKIALVKN